MAQQLLVIGKRLPYKNARAVVTGRLEYYSDHMAKDMLHMSILRSTYAHAKIKSISVTKALALPGVKGVITHNDVPDLLLNEPDLVKILNDKVFYHGCEVAAVAADSLEIAEEAISLIEVEYEPLQILLDPEEAMKAEAPEVHEGTPNLIFGEPLVVEWGNVDDGLKDADEIVEGVYTSQKDFNIALENHGTIAYWDPDDNLTIRTGTQASHELRKCLAPALGLPENKVRIIQHRMGGAFGSKTYHLRHHGIAALLSKQTGRPVKFVGWQQDEFTRSNTRNGFKWEIKMGLKKDGSITACEIINTMNTGTYFESAIATQYVAMHPINLYPIPNMFWAGYSVYTNCPPAGAKRGFGTPEAFYSFDQHLEVAAEAIGMDPIEFRKKNFVRSGDPWGAVKTLSSCELDKCIDEAAEAIEWKDKWKGFGTPYSVSGPKRKAVGISACSHIAAFGFDCVVVKLQSDGSATIISGACDAGMEHATSLSMICAETLGIPYEKVTLVAGDTASSPYVTGTYSSRICCGNGNAIKLASEDILRQLFEVAARTLNADQETLTVENGVIAVKDNPTKAISIAEVMEDSILPPVLVGIGRWKVPEEYEIQGFAACATDLEVDVETGEVTILKMVDATDCGQPIHPSIVEDQVIGGISSQGIGASLKEDPVLDKATGKVLNLNLIDYKIPTGLDVPDINCILVDSYEPLGPYGAKGAGEIVLTPIGASIANAIYNAIGTRITSYPITPDKILKALGKA